MKALHRGQSGGALIMVLVITTLVGSVLVAYLSMLKSQNTYSSRSLAWNTAMPMAEAGIEEALAHINYSGTTNLASNGWVKTNNQYVGERTLTNGYAKIMISTDTAPFIISTGYVKAPLQNAYISRTVRAGTRKRSPFQAGFTAKGSVTMSGGMLDSFDSSDPLYATVGYGAATRHANGKIQTASSALGAINTGNALVYGKVSTAPGGTAIPGSSGSVGDIAWNANPGNKGSIEPGYSSADVNLSLEDVAVPFTNGYATPSSGSYAYQGTNYTYKLDSGNYKLSSDLNLASHDTIVVTSNAVLYLTGQFSIAGNAYIYIPPGGNLKLYIGSPSASIGGGGVMNGTGNATNFSIFCLGTCTSMSYAGNSAFIGTVYAPQTDLTLTGTADAFGALVGKTINVGGNLNFHYDEALGGGNSKYIVISWSEL
jgi:Tfp pilus assembly protein PilX